MRFISIILASLLLCSCSLWREEAQETVNEKKQETQVRVLDGEVTIKGTVTLPTFGAVPIDVVITNTEKEKTVSKSEAESESEKKSTKESSSPATEQGFGWIGYLISTLIVGGGAAGLVKRVMTNKMKQLVDGVSSYEEEAPEEAKKLKTHLSRKMDADTKSLVKKIK